MTDLNVPLVTDSTFSLSVGQEIRGGNNHSDHSPNHKAVSPVTSRTHRPSRKTPIPLGCASKVPNDRLMHISWVILWWGIPHQMEEMNPSFQSLAGIRKSFPAPICLFTLLHHWRNEAIPGSVDVTEMSVTGVLLYEFPGPLVAPRVRTLKSSNSHQAAAILTWRWAIRSSGCKNHRTLALVREVHMKGMGFQWAWTHASSHRKVLNSFNLGYLVFFNWIIIL